MLSAFITHASMKIVCKKCPRLYKHILIYMKKTFIDLFPIALQSNLRKYLKNVLLLTYVSISLSFICIPNPENEQSFLHSRIRYG